MGGHTRVVHPFWWTRYFWGGFAGVNAANFMAEWQYEIPRSKNTDVAWLPLGGAFWVISRFLFCSGDVLNCLQGWCLCNQNGKNRSGEMSSHVPMF
jgi:hypothetical protein